jgi:2'-5' RNA ligase
VTAPAPPIRSFVAVHVDAATRAALAAAASELATVAPGLRWVKPELFHFTLRFLGDVDEAAVPDLLAAIRESATASSVRAFGIEVAGLGAFPGPARPRVVWAGVRRGADELTAIASQLAPRLARLGLPREEHRFTPHLTLARARQPLDRRAADTLASRLAASADRVFGTVVIGEVHLMKSELSPSGPTYSSLGTVPLPDGTA